MESQMGPPKKKKWGGGARHGRRPFVNCKMRLCMWCIGHWVGSQMMMMTWLEEEAIHRPELHNARPKCTKGVATPQSLNDVC